ncbi:MULTISPECIES: hypothetical protein [unclassified Dyella]|jgi:hypothetical protein|uniref:hypothetical protein n=1 Tax=unclassified Dyella TaxID=2634549 RepID=UPI003F901D0B
MPSKTRRGATIQRDLAELANDPRFVAGFERAQLKRVEPIVGGIAAIVDIGQSVIRSDDFLSINFSLINLDVVAPDGHGPATLKARQGKTGYIVLRFAPQSISEEVYYQAPTGSIKDRDPQCPPTSPPANMAGEPPRFPPIPSRIANGSRAVFRYDAKLLADANMLPVPYTLQGILEACLHLPLSITANAARGPARRIVVGPLTGVLQKRQRAAFAALTPGQQARTLATTLRNLRIVQNGGPEGLHLLLRRAELRADQLAVPAEQAGTEVLEPGRPVAGTVRPAAHQSLHSASAMALYGVVGSAGLEVTKIPPSWYLLPPIPSLPTATQTSLELPYRLILSPNETGRFVHAITSQTFTPTGCTPLWHTRLGCLDGTTGVFKEGPNSGTQVRAIWARFGPQSVPSTFDPGIPKPTTTPAPNAVPFRMTLDDRDRFNIVHESSNFRISDGNQEPIECHRLMLSALGGWLDARGAWKVPHGLSVEEWVHQATQARDHYVKVVYKGYLCPFGHQVSLVKVSERKFHHDRPGNPAYLRQRTFIIVREPVHSYPTMTIPSSDALPGVADSAYTRYFHRQFPFSQIRCLTHVTPDLQNPGGKDVDDKDMQMFWPCVDKDTPFRFRFVGTDLDGKHVAFEMPGIFIDNSLANPSPDGDRSDAETNFDKVQADWYTDDNKPWRKATTHRQRVCMAPSQKHGDTSCELEEIEFGMEVRQLRHDPATRTGPLTYPSIQQATAFIPSLTYLTGGTTGSELHWNKQYAARRNDFDKGEVFADIKNGPDLDFTSKGDRSGGFVQPNLRPSGMSRLAGPFAGDVAAFNSGAFDGSQAFSAIVNPVLFGCIPLGELLNLVNIDTDGIDRLPKFVSEAADALQDFIGALGNTNDLLGQLEGMASSAAQSALEQAIDLAFKQIKPQIQALDATTATLAGKLDQAAGAGKGLINAIKAADAFKPPASGLTTALNNMQGELGNLLAAVNLRITQLPGSGLSTAVQNVVQQQLVPIRTRVAQIQALVDDIRRIPAMVGPAEALFNAVSKLLVQPEQLPDLLANTTDLKNNIDAVGNALTDFQAAFDKINLFAGGVRGTVDRIAITLRSITDKAADITQLLSSLLGDEITVRFDWHPIIKPWPEPSNTLYGPLGTLFQPRDKDAFIVAVEAKVKKSTGEAHVKVLCGLRAFDLILLGEKLGFMKLAFEKIEFRADSSAKMDVDVKFDGIHFIGPLKFVETLKDLIPLDGFSDPPSLDISPKGIDASFSMALPNLAVGVLNLSNLSLGAGFTVPFIGQPLSVRFNFCTREQPFCLTVSMFGGGGFFGITIDPHGVQLMEAAFEFGAAIAVDFGVASGGVHVMAGIYFRMEKDACQLAGYFRLGGNVSVLGIISVSIELYLALSYDSGTGKAKGEATLTIAVSLFMFSVSAAIHCERSFAGSNGDPSFAALMGPEAGPVTDDSKYPWHDYVDAFA